MTELPLESLIPTATVVPKRVLGYAKMKGAAPAVLYVTDPKEKTRYVVDGNHRWFAALSEGKAVINAEELNVPPEVKKRLLSQILGK